MAKGLYFVKPIEQPHKRDCGCYACETAFRQIALARLSREDWIRLDELRRKSRGQAVRLTGIALQKAFDRNQL